MSKIRLIGGLFCLTFLNACSASFLDTASRNIFLQEDVNLTEYNYSAADYLAGLTLDTVGKAMPIEVNALQHANQVGMGSAFGDLVADQVGARFAQLGYNVLAPEMIEKKKAAKRGVLLSGTYMTMGQNADVSLRMVDKQSGRILGAFDYTIPVNYEISDLLEPRPTIIRTTPVQ